MSKPVLKWAGGKGKLLEQFAPLLPESINNYYEPFLGGGAMFFSLEEQKRFSGVAYLWDINDRLINFYQCLKSNPARLIHTLETHAALYQADPEHYYYSVRAKQAFSGMEGAGNFGFLNKTAFNGLYRVNQQGKFNVPWGRYKKPLICDPVALQEASKALKVSRLQSRGFRGVWPYPKPGDFVYLDPPYIPLSDTAGFTMYNLAGFGPEDQLAVRGLVDTLTQRGVNVMISNSDCPDTLELYSKYKIYRVEISRGITSTAPNSKKTVTELVITNY